MVVYGICCIESDGQREKAVCTMFSHSAKDCSPSLICRPQRRPVLCTIPIIAGSSVFLSLVLMQAKKQSLQGGAVFSTYGPTVHLTALRTRGCHGLSRGLQNEGRLCMDTEGHTQSHVLETGFSEPEEEKVPRSWLLAKTLGPCMKWTIQQAATAQLLKAAQLCRSRSVRCGLKTGRTYLYHSEAGSRGRPVQAFDLQIGFVRILPVSSRHEHTWPGVNLTVFVDGVPYAAALAFPQTPVTV